MYVGCQGCFSSDRELSCLAKFHGDKACSLPGNLGHPQSYTALYKSLKYSTCTGVVTVQKYTSTLCLCLFLRTSFPACSRVWELCVLFLPGDCCGAQQSGQGKTVHLPFITHYIFHTATVCRIYPKKKKAYTSLSACVSATNSPGGNRAHSGDDSTSHLNTQGISTANVFWECLTNVKPLHSQRICVLRKLRTLCLPLHMTHICRGH